MDIEKTPLLGLFEKWFSPIFSDEELEKMLNDEELPKGIIYYLDY